MTSNLSTASPAGVLETGPTAVVEMTLECFEQRVIVGREIALVTFFAPWCAPSGLQAPIIEQLAADFAGQALVGRVDVDAQDTLAQRFLVRTLPTSLIFAEGELVEGLVGFQADEYLRAYLVHLTSQKKPAET